MNIVLEILGSLGDLVDMPDGISSLSRPVRVLCGLLLSVVKLLVPFIKQDLLGFLHMSHYDPLMQQISPLYV